MYYIKHIKKSKELVFFFDIPIVTGPPSSTRANIKATNGAITLLSILRLNCFTANNKIQYSKKKTSHSDSASSHAQTTEATNVCSTLVYAATNSSISDLSQHSSPCRSQRLEPVTKKRRYRRFNTATPQIGVRAFTRERQ